MDKKKKIYIFIAILLCAGIATWPLIIVFKRINAPKEDCKDINPEEANKDEYAGEPHFKPMPLSDSQARLYDNYHKNLIESVDIEAFIDGKSWPAFISTSRLSYDDAKSFCQERNASLLHKTTSSIKPLPDFVRLATYKYWIYAEYTTDFEILEINEEIRRLIKYEFDEAKHRKDYIFFCRDCNQELHDDDLPTSCLKNSASALPDGRELEYICADRVFHDGKVLIQIEKTVNCDLLKLNASFLDEYGLWKNDNLPGIMEGPKKGA